MSWTNESKKPAWSNNIAPLVSFADVMSEQLANSLSEEDGRQDAWEIKEDISCAHQCSVTPNLQDCSTLDTSSDEALARMLQAEMDKEFNESLTKREERMNRNSKVKTSLNNYKVDGDYDDDSSTFDSEEDEEEILDDNRHPKSTQNGSVKTMVTKHDKEVCSRRNTSRMENSFPPGFLSGDAGGMDLQLSNPIYNSLKQHAYSEERRSHRLHETKEHYTTEHAVDEKTRLILHRLVNNGILASVNGIISVGKESVVIHADGDEASGDTGNRNGYALEPGRTVPSECAIKIFKTTLNEFRTRDKYIKDDYRFKDRFKKLNPRKIIHMWAEKEMSNLIRIRKAGILCPEVVMLKKHVLVMSFIGTDQRHAPKLKDAVLSSSQKKSAYAQVKHIMKTMYSVCRLIHADLSEYNLLWKNEHVWVIDVSQSVEPNHPHGLEFLYRDCQNTSRFFSNLRVEDVSAPMQLFNEVSGLNLNTANETEFISELETLQNMAEEHSHQSVNKSKALIE